jgi:UDP-N-acetylglucosamine 1-carboxyvinyltransferase
MNGTFRIVGGSPLTGTANPIVNKNSLMGALPMALLTDKGVSYRSLPETSDVERFLEIYRKWGAHIEMEGEELTSISAAPCKDHRVDPLVGSEFRGAFSLAGPLLARYGKAAVALPGGCKLGNRSVSVHVDAFKRLGIQTEVGNNEISFKIPKHQKKSARLWLLEASVTATLNIALFAAGTDMELELIDASCEPHVTDVLNALSDMGAKISGIGTNHLFIKGNSNLKGTVFSPSPDHVDIAGYLVAAALTKGKIRITGANKPLIMDGIINWFDLFNVSIERDGDDLVVDGTKELYLKMENFPLAGKDLPKFVVRPWPGFPVDILPVMVTLATKTEGNLLFQNWMYESGFDFVRELIYMGAEIYISDPQKIIVLEPVVDFRGGEVAAPGIIQGTKAIFLAALADPAVTIIHGTDILKRRYPRIFDNYTSLGASIEKCS